MKKLHAILLFCFAVSCAPTHRPVPPGVVPSIKRVSVSDEQYGHTVLTELSQNFPIENDDRYVNRARDVVSRLAEAIQANHEPWHVYVLRGDKVINAAATRGNHVFVWTGMLRTAQSDPELAVVLAHEIGHLLAGHTNEDPNQRSREILAAILGVAAATAVGAGGGQAGSQLAGSLTQSIAQGFLVNPYSQQNELEADQIGLFLMARAGYDPRVARVFWQKIQNMPEFNNGGSQFFSSHPSPTGRISNIERNLPRAIRDYEDSLGRPTQISVPRIEARSRGGEPWIVVDRGILVHVAPAPQAKVVTDLRQGDEVSVSDRIGQWLRIEKPVRGFVLGRGLSPR